MNENIKEAAKTERMKLLGGLNSLALNCAKDLGLMNEDGKHTLKINLEYGSALIELRWSDNPLPISDEERCVWFTPVNEGGYSTN